MYTLKNDALEAIVNPIGAELTSLIRDGSGNDSGNNSELMWRGDSNFWGGRAPIMFPIVGALKDGSMTHQGQQYEMPRHGIARRARFDCIDHSSAQLVMSLRASESSMQHYPWDFELQVHFTLRQSSLEIAYRVINHDADKMLFTIGSHPAFALRIDDVYQFNDYSIAFELPEDFAFYPLTDDGLLEKTTRRFHVDGNRITLSESIFNEDALVLRDIKSKRISLQRGDTTQLTVDTGGAPHLGIWSKPGAPFVCIEPWFGTSDFVDAGSEFAAKPDIISLAPEAIFDHTIGINLPPV